MRNGDLIWSGCPGRTISSGHGTRMMSHSRRALPERQTGRQSTHRRHHSERTHARVHRRHHSWVIARILQELRHLATAKTRNWTTAENHEFPFRLIGTSSRSSDHGLLATAVIMTKFYARPQRDSHCMPLRRRSQSCPRRTIADYAHLGIILAPSFPVAKAIIVLPSCTELRVLETRVRRHCKRQFSATHGAIAGLAA